MKKPKLVTLEVKSRFKSVAGFACAALLAISAGCAQERAQSAALVDNLSTSSSAEEFIRATKAVEQGYLKIGEMSLDQVERVGELDQQARRIDDLIRNSPLSANDKMPLSGGVALIMYKNDGARSQELLALKPQGRWFNAQELTPSGHKSAWLIVQHGRPEIQKALVPELLEASKQGLVPARDVAMLTDRIEVNGGRPQSYGSQASCENGKLVFFPLENPANIDALRRSVGFTTTFEEYKTMMMSEKQC